MKYIIYIDINIQYNDVVRKKGFTPLHTIP